MRKLFLLMAFLFIGCEDLDRYSQEYVNFVDEHKSDIRYYCDLQIGFLMKEFIGEKDTVSTVILMLNMHGEPIECNHVY